MLKPKKEFVQNHLNIERLTPLQWDGIMRSMDEYAEHYAKENREFCQFTIATAMFCSVSPNCYYCKFRPKVK